MTDDINKGIVDRFRSLPMARSAVLTGRTSSDVIYNAGILVVLMVTGFVVGWPVHTGFGALLAGFALLLLFAYAMVWLGVWLGLTVPTVEVGQQVIFTVLFPITFVSTVFVPLASMPTWLQPFAEWNPTSTLSSSLRRCGATRRRTRRRQPGVHRAAPCDARLGRGHHRGLRAARRAALSLDEPLTRRPLRAPTIIGYAARPRSPRRRTGPRIDRPAAGEAAPAGRVPSRTIGLYAVCLWALAFFLAVRPVAARFLVPILLIAYLAPFVAAPGRLSRIVARGRGRGGPGGTGGMVSRPAADQERHAARRRVGPE